MPVITFANNKGGAGKTTSCIILGSELSQHYTVTIIDADPAQRLSRWASRDALPDELKVKACSSEDQILDVLDEAREASQFVLVDTEGVASRLNTMINLNSNLVIIPMGDEQQDAEDAVATLKQLKDDGRTVGREVNARVLFTRVKAAVKSTFEKEINASMRENVPSFKTELVNRTAFSTLHNAGGTLRTIDRAGRMEKAIENAERLTEEVISTFTQEAAQ